MTFFFYKQIMIENENLQENDSDQDDKLQKCYLLQKYFQKLDPFDSTVHDEVIKQYNGSV